MTLPNSIELSCRKPVIAAIHNACVGGGVDFITAADIRICTEDAYFQVIKLNYSTHILMCGKLLKPPHSGSSFVELLAFCTDAPAHSDHACSDNLAIGTLLAGPKVPI